MSVVRAWFLHCIRLRDLGTVIATNLFSDCACASSYFCASLVYSAVTLSVFNCVSEERADRWSSRAQHFGVSGFTAAVSVVPIILVVRCKYALHYYTEQCQTL